MAIQMNISMFYRAMDRITFHLHLTRLWILIILVISKIHLRIILDYMLIFRRSLMLWKPATLRWAYLN